MEFTINEAVNVLSQKFLLQEGITGVSHHSEQLVVYVERPEDALKVPRTLMDFPVKTFTTGKIRILALPPPEMGRTLAGILAGRSDRWRPVPGGCSIGSINITAGTNASRVYDLRTGLKLFLSNHHVFYGAPGTPVLQPGPYDGGRDPDDRVAVIERFAPFRTPPDTNLVDAALARPLRQDLVSDEILDIGVVSDVEPPSVDMRIAKSGRSCGYGEARIMDVNASVKVEGYPEVGTLIFEDQIITDTALGRPGDSGSLVVNVDTGRAVGLLFAGSDRVTVLNKITNVVRVLGVSFSPVPARVPVAPPVLAPVQILFGAVAAGSFM